MNHTKILFLEGSFTMSSLWLSHDVIFFVFYLFTPKNDFAFSCTVIAVINHILLHMIYSVQSDVV